MEQDNNLLTIYFTDESLMRTQTVCVNELILLLIATDQRSRMSTSSQVGRDIPVVTGTALAPEP